MVVNDGISGLLPIGIQILPSLVVRTVEPFDSMKVTTFKLTFFWKLERVRNEIISTSTTWFRSIVSTIPEWIYCFINDKFAGCICDEFIDIVGQIRKIVIWSYGAGKYGRQVFLSAL